MIHLTITLLISILLCNIPVQSENYEHAMPNIIVQL